MMMNWTLLPRMVLATLAAAFGCSADPDAGPDVPCEGKCDGVERDFEFSSDNPHTLEIIDHMGTALTSTSLTNRDDDYQSVAPDSLSYLATFLIHLRKMHDMFDDSLAAQGLESCAGIILVTPCTLQRLWEGGPIVSDVVVPDSIEIHLDEPARWPNGRSIQVCSTDGAWHSDGDCAALGGRIEYLQINDVVLAMGFLDLGAACPGAPGGVCRLETFLDMKLNIDHNDVALPNEFPYLGPPHP
jgi:hypothetical protein